MSDNGRRVRIEVEGATAEGITVLVSPNRASVMVDLQDPTSVTFRDGSVLYRYMPLLGDGQSADYTCILNGAAVKMTWL